LLHLLCQSRQIKKRKKMIQPTNDQIFKAIERITGWHIVTFHNEASRYAFKDFVNQQWHTLDIDFVNDIAVWL